MLVKINIILLVMVSFCSSAWFYLSANSSHMVEICDNGIDDDMDGLVDINDDDCHCSPVVPSGLIPNPSFEQSSCCPDRKARLDCADSWIQASAATTDYVNTCGFLGNVINAPLPIADGDGAIGLRDGSPDNGNYKEYAGACLSEPIEAGKLYKLKISVGFTNTDTSPGLLLTIYGHPSCAALPFGDNNASIGCPLNVNGWIEIGKASVSGENEWIDAEIDFSTHQNISAVAIGPDCGLRPSGEERYYFFDNLRLAETINFGYQVDVEGGNPCLTDFDLSLTGNASGETYQWYRNGIAIVGATQPNYSVPEDVNREAVYQVRIQDASGCQITDAYDVSIAKTTMAVNDFACYNSTYIFGNQNLTSPGMYTENFVDIDGCDSMVTLQLDFRTPVMSIIDTTICQGQSISLGGDQLYTAGDYSVVLIDQYGCDSLVEVSLHVREPAAMIDLMDQTIDLGNSTVIDLQGQEGSIASFEWSRSDLGMICPDCPSQTVVPVENTSYYLDALDISNCVIKDTINISVTKNYSIYIPNVFSPNGDGVNDIFTLYPSTALDMVKSFRVFDRWGNLMYETMNSIDIQWDGRHQGQDLNMESLVYVAEVVFIDGHMKTVSGSIQLIR